ncbi:hypothetical protein VB735_12595 [Halotia wernerae UHCC 0503]|nr:hypothetical protein [Halotia wernerae UHCC 0503]
MTHLTNKVFMNMVSFAETPSVIANAADKLLSYVLLKDDVAAACTVRYYCQRIARYVGQQVRVTCCTKRGCTSRSTGVFCNPGV